MDSADKTSKLEKWQFPIFEMPSIWYNEDEIYNLMQTFKRPREIDPTSYDLKIDFWTNLIEKYTLHHHMIVTSESELQTIFTKEFKTHGLSLKPQCLSTVLKAMEVSGKVVPKSQFEQGSLVWRVVSGIGWLASAPIQWSYSAVSSMFSAPQPNGPPTASGVPNELVTPRSVERCLPEFLGWLVARAESLLVSTHHDLVPRAAFQTLLADYFRHSASRTLAQDLLITRGLIALVSLPAVTDAAVGPSEPVELVRFARSPDSPLATGARGPLDRQTADQIRGLMQLRALSRRLEADEALLEQKLASIKAAAKAALRNKRVEEAKKHMKRGKSIEKVLERKRTQMQNVETMLMEIETSSDNVQVVRALSEAVGVLRARSMDIDSVHDVMAEVGDALADQEDINVSLATAGGLGGAQQADALAELEADLTRLLASEESAQHKDLLDMLPEVPAGPVSPPRRHGDTASPLPGR